ncbi:MAG: Hsp70 family protein, partial [Gammaproteobacteria bacterium]|nr:Hsp70 family protein [Gammaproteobacteria bacterium]
AMIHATEKTLKDLGDQVEAEDRVKIENAVSDLKTALKGNDKAVIETKTQALAEASSKLAEKAYSANAESEGPDPVDANASSSSDNSKDDVVDAEFEEVKDDKK